MIPHAANRRFDERLSLGASVVLLLLYAANLIYTLVTHRAMFAGEAASGRPSGVLPERWPWEFDPARLPIGRRPCAESNRSRTLEP